MKKELKPEERVRASVFWQKINALRKIPGHCSRCGKVHTGEFKRCDKCRNWQKGYKSREYNRVLGMMFVEKGKTLEALARRVGSLEIAVARLQLDGKLAYQRGYRQAELKRKRMIESNKRNLRFEVGNEFARNTKTDIETLRMVSSRRN